MTGAEFARQKSVQRSKQYYAQNTEKCKAYSKAYYQAHKERYAELQRLRRQRRRAEKPKEEKKPFDRKAYMKAWRAANPDYDKQYYAAHVEEIRVKNRERMRAKRAKLKEEATA